MLYLCVESFLFRFQQNAISFFLCFCIAHPIFSPFSIQFIKSFTFIVEFPNGFGAKQNAASKFVQNSRMVCRILLLSFRNPLISNGRAVVGSYKNCQNTESLFALRREKIIFFHLIWIKFLHLIFLKIECIEFKGNPISHRKSIYCSLYIGRTDKRLELATVPEFQLAAKR